MLGLILAGSFIYHMLGYGKDDTDPPDGVSGLGLYTDNATGCQYLAIRRTGITPRMSATGAHLGCKVQP